MHVNNLTLVRQALESIKCPVGGVIVDIVEFEPNRSFGYRLYRDNISDYSDSQIQDIYDWLRQRAVTAETLSTASVGIDIAGTVGEDN